MRFILSNDDGIDAPGLAALEVAARQLGEPIVVAPADALSGCSHRVTTDRPFRVLHREKQRYAVDGTPADCVRVALHRFADKPAYVLSGINAGGNLGADVHHSGTVAAVREAVLHGIPGIAVSHYIRRGIPLDWARATALITPILRDLLTRPWTPGSFWNVNLPHPEPGQADPELVFCPLDPTPLPLSFREDGDWLHYNGDYHRRQRVAGADVDVCFAGKIAVTLISLL
jgi:5'-nucleotidase